MSGIGLASVWVALAINNLNTRPSSGLTFLLVLGLSKLFRGMTAALPDHSVASEMRQNSCMYLS